MLFRFRSSVCRLCFCMRLPYQKLIWFELFKICCVSMEQYVFRFCFIILFDIQWRFIMDFYNGLTLLLYCPGDIELNSLLYSTHSQTKVIRFSCYQRNGIYFSFFSRLMCCAMFSYTFLYFRPTQVTTQQFLYQTYST